MDRLSLEHCWLFRGDNGLKITWLLIQETIIANGFCIRNRVFCLPAISMMFFCSGLGLNGALVLHHNHFVLLSADSHVFVGCVSLYSFPAPGSDSLPTSSSARCMSLARKEWDIEVSIPKHLILWIIVTWSLQQSTLTIIRNLFPKGWESHNLYK